MKEKKSNIFSQIPNDLSEEVFEDIVKNPHVRIERIVSYGHSSPETGWYDQEENEWVMVLKGQGVLEFEDGRIVVLESGDYLNIKAHEKHKVAATKADEETIWLAVFY
ncbi:cupin domain-containing protein [Vibrio sp. SCSIO 43136]|uniref:cupin domain-containing protein n=1 Tax=Vibrio sp. SCSIO 43136 TaxID=2819101 RepID=UPI0020753F0E|nr:cupin domain-containing protein [Vibrio sp. SCSIO 43136]USD67553.1 cupin domain-containing protein [Vibrio sp. SCSIO 43136]